jgi:ferritin-like metal-binding protein YciE
MTKTQTLQRKATTGKTARSRVSAPSAKSHKSLDDLLEDGLREIYSAETQLLDAMPELAAACYSEDLQDAVNHHMEETRRHVERLEKVFRRLDIERTGNESCPAMEGLISEVRKVIGDYDESPVRDSALIIGAQKIEHYEIACYGSLCELCDVLGYWNMCDLLGRTLDEEEKTDLELTEIAMYVNDDAYEMSENDAEEEESEEEEEE